MEKHFEFLILEKKFKTEEMLEYNKRLDKLVIIYISSLFAVLGLRASGQIQLEGFFTNIEFAFLALIFVVLNQCILLHSLSQSSYTISLAKYIHTEINAQIYKILNHRQNNFAIPFSEDLLKTKQIDKRNSWGYLDWDDWELEIKDVSNSTRTIVFAIWVIIVMFISFIMLSAVRLYEFCTQNYFVSFLILTVILILQFCINFYGLKYGYCISKFHVRSDIVAKNFKKFKFLLLALLFDIIFVCLYLLFN